MLLKVVFLSLAFIKMAKTFNQKYTKSINRYQTILNY